MSFIIGLIILPLAFFALISYLLIFWNRKSGKKKNMGEDVLDNDEAIMFPKSISKVWKPDYSDIFELDDVVDWRMVEGIPMDTVFEERKRYLGKGNTVKLRFNIFVQVEFGALKETEVAVEELWVLIEDRKEEMYYGILANEPDEPETKLKQGYRFCFHTNHILEIG